MIKNVLGVETTLKPGGRGEYTVWVDGAKVADKAGGDFPTEQEVVTAVQAAITPSTPSR